MSRLLLLMALAASALTAPAAAGAAVSPPEPTGPAPVGFTRVTLTDHHRSEVIADREGPRRIPLRVWYPAADGGGSPGAVLTPSEQAQYEAGFGLPPGAFDGFGDTSRAGAAPAPGRHAVILLSHGGGLSTAFHVAQATDLASRGLVVVGIDHPGDAELVDLGGGDLVYSNPVGDDFRERSFVQRVADLRYVAHHLRAVRRAGRLSRAHLGVYGHSVGGASAAEAMFEDRRFAAGVNLDGAMLGGVIDGGLDRPFATLLGEFPLEVYDGLETFRARSTGPNSLTRFGTTGHQAFTDIVWLVPQLGANPADFQLGTVDPREAIAAQRRFLGRFFERYLDV